MGIVTHMCGLIRDSRGNGVSSGRDLDEVLSRPAFCPSSDSSGTEFLRSELLQDLCRKHASTCTCMNVSVGGIELSFRNEIAFICFIVLSLWTFFMFLLFTFVYSYIK